MREILFRGKRIMNDQWVEGYYSEYSYELGQGDFICAADFDYTVYPDSVGQFTGLYDKNGKRVFEGDIIYMGLFPYVVKYDRENARYMLYTSGDSKRDGFNAFTMETHEVSGNIHDNPELLK